MQTFIITDTHFGVKNNSIIWLNSQLNFFYKQFIPHMKKVTKSGEPLRVIHMGDVFDSRSTISTMIATKVIQLFKDIAANCDSIYIIAGNHDFYSPNSAEINTNELLLNNISDNIKLITDQLYEPQDVYNSNELFVPWYQWIDQESLLPVLKKSGIKTIYTHADIVTNPPRGYNGIKIYSGHVHIPHKDGNLYTIGSCFAQDFADANSSRGYIWQHDSDSDKDEFIENKFSIRFWRLYNKEIFDKEKLSLINPDDYIEMYVTQTNLQSDDYINQVNTLSKKYKNIWTIPQVVEIEGILDAEEFSGYDIEAIAKKSIPDELKTKFEIVLKRASED